MRKLSDRELCMRAAQLKAKLHHSNRDTKLIYGDQGKFFDNSVFDDRHYNKNALKQRIRIPEPVKIGRFNCVKFADGSIQLIFKNSLWAAEFGKLPDGRFGAKLRNGTVVADR